MARRVLRSPSNPPWLNGLLWVCEFAASLKLAVVLIFGSVAVLALGTFVEHYWGTQTASNAVYGTNWFEALNALLALNIFAAAAIRFPWKRHQTGFVITHIGLLTLLFGCWLMRSGGIDAQLSVFEMDRGRIGVEDDQFFLLKVEPADAGDSTNQANGTKESSGAQEHEDGIPVPFLGSPFNWVDLDQPAWFPWAVPKAKLAKEDSLLAGMLRWLVWPAYDRGVLYDRDGIKLEVLDYYASARVSLDTSRVELRIAMPRMMQRDEDGNETLSAEGWMPVEVVEDPDPIRRMFSDRGSVHRQKAGGGDVVFWRAKSAEEAQAFLKCKPQGPIGEQGQVVLFAQGQVFPLDVKERLGKPRQPLGSTGLQVELADHGAHPTLKTAEVVVHAADGKTGRVRLTADLPEVNQYDLAHGVYGAYWYQHPIANEAERMQGKARSRVDIIEAPGEKLYYRYWKAPQVVFAGELPTTGKQQVDGLQMRDTTLKMYVHQFDPANSVRPAEFDKQRRPVDLTRAARVKLTVDDASREFWVIGTHPVLSQYDPKSPLEEQTVSSGKRSVKVTLNLRTVDIGVDVELVNFERRLDPGTSQASHYSSYVNFYAPAGSEPSGGSGGKKLNGDQPVWITMNAPVEMVDPASGRRYRLYQEGFQPADGTWGPGTQFFALKGRPDLGRNDVYMSTFAINYNPGRGTIYAGCALIVAGIATMFYMKAYFFKPRAKAEAKAEVKKPEAKRKLAAATHY